MKFFNYVPINEYTERNKVTIELDNELLDKIEKFFIDVLKEEEFEPYDLINGYAISTDDSFYFDYEKNSILDPESYLFLGTTGIVMESFSKFLNYENERNEINLKELNEYILENKNEIKKHFSNIKTFEGYNNEDISLELKYEKDKDKEFIEINRLVSDQRENIYSYLENNDTEKTFINKDYVTSELLNQIKEKFYLNLEDKENQVKPVSVEKFSIEKENFDNLDINDISYIQKLIKNKIIENLERENDKILIVDANNAIDTSINQDFLLKRTQEYNCDINTMSNIIEIEKNEIKKILPSISINCDGYKMIDTETIREDINKLLEEKQKTAISKEKDEKKKNFEKEL